MKAVIMAGGKGTRLRPICEKMPKPMTELLGKPLLAHLIELLRSNGFTELCVTLGHMPEAISSYFKDGSDLGVSIQYQIEETPLGTAGGVRACKDFIGEDDFLVISGDAACDFDLNYLRREHKRRGAPVTMALFSHEEPLPYGTVLLNRENRVISFIEKPSWERVVTDLVNTGIYMLSPRVLDLIPEDRPFDFARDLFPLMAKQDLPIIGLPMKGYWCDIGSPESYYRCSMDALEGKLRLRPATARRSSGVYAPVNLPESVRLIPPCVVCEGAQLGEETVISGSVIHAGSRIGAHSRILSSVVDRATVSEYCVVSGSILCRGAVLYPDTVTGLGDVISPTGATPPSLTAAEPESSKPRKAQGLCREIACTSRARLMRELSGILWEAGADFTDGIHLTDGRCRVRISPLAEESSISVEAIGGREADRLAICKKYSALAEGFGGRALS